ncbi:FG-GAP repeat domain-containing protein, partial [Calditrichota bacterium]
MKSISLVSLSLSFLILLVSAGQAQIEFTEHTIADSFDYVISVYAIDIDDDGDIDVLGAAYTANDITWWENDGEQDFTEHTIAGDFNGAWSVYAADIDSDGDMDVLGASWRANAITWWENDGEQDFTEHTIAGDFNGVWSVYAADIDNDGDMDVLGAASYADDITWWENDGEQHFTEHTIAGNFDGAHSVYAADIDSDGDMDVLGAAYSADDIAWWENDGEQDFTEHTIAGDFSDAISVYAIDIDSDGDMDVLGANSNAITWWENDGEQHFTEHTIAGVLRSANSVYAADIDNDGDMDVLGAAGGITWWENDGEQDFTEHTIADNFSGASSVYAADVDGDGDMDVLGAAFMADDITWWENRGSPPEDFELISPENHEIVYDDTASAIWSSSSDPDGLEYIIEWTLFEGFPRDSSMIESTEDTFFVISDVRDFFMAGYEIDELPDDVIIYWRVKAVDDLGSDTWANDNREGWSFNVYIPDPPSPFHLLAPLNGTLHPTPTVLLEWEISIDPDPGDSISYTVYLAEDEDFTVPDFIETGPDNYLLLDSLTDNQTYWWKVLAEDTDALRAWSEETRSFTYVRYRAPTDLNAELNEENGEVFLTWSHDPGLERFLCFNIYRDNRLINSDVDTCCTDILPSHGVYRYCVTANYLHVETEAVDTVTVYWGVESAGTEPFP